MSVSRGERSAAEWMTALRALGSGAGDYRHAATTPDVLLRIVEDPALPADARVGAAVALRASRDLAAPQKIRVAASATAEPELREALESVLDDDTSLEERVARMHVLSSPTAQRTDR